MEKGETAIRFQLAKSNVLRFSAALVYEVDLFVCAKCSSEMKMIAIIEDPEETERILRHSAKIGRPPPGFEPKHRK